MRLFLDANVIFSAALGPSTRARTLLDLALVRGFTLMSSSLAIEEARRNLASKAPHALSEFVGVVAKVVVSQGPRPDLIAWAGAQGLPPKDAPVLAAAVTAEADLLVTGDRRHFGHLFGRTLKGVAVTPLSEALHLVLEGATGGNGGSRQDLP